MSSGGNKEEGGGGFAIFIVAMLAIAAVIWFLSTVGHFLGLTPTWSEATDKPDGWVGDHYEGVAVGYLLTVAALVVVGLLAWFALAASSADAAMKEIGARRLRSTASWGAVLLIAILALPIGQKDVVETSPAAAASEDGSDSSANDYTSTASSDDAEARERRRAKKARAKRRERREQRERRAREKREEAALIAEAEPESSAGGNCDPSYDPCVPPGPPDLNCSDLDGPVSVSGEDPHGLDADGDGDGCEASSSGGGSSSSSSDGGGSSSSGGNGPSTTNWCGKRDGDGDGLYCE